MAKSVTSELIKLKNVRLSFPNLYTKKVYPGASEENSKYEASFLIHKKDQKELISKIQDTIKKMFEKAEFKGKLAADKICLKDGDLFISDETGKVFDGYEGHMSIKASNKHQPACFAGARGQELIPTDDGTFYAGCYVNANIELWFQDNQFGKRVNANLKGVQFFKDGESFTGSKVSTSSDFDEVDYDSEF